MYVRQPAITGDLIVFVSEDDLWSVPATGGSPRRLTSGRGVSSGPRIAPDGRHIAFIGAEEGVADLYVMPIDGGPTRRLTWLAGTTSVAGFLPDGRVVIATDALSPFFRDNRLFAVPIEGGEPERLPYGLGAAVSFAADGRVALCRHADDLARWKRYRGGRAGVIWVDAGSGFRRLLDVSAQQACPMWLGERVFFLSDHDGHGNLWSSRDDGSDLVRHTDHADFYARSASSDGARVVYTCGADLWSWDAATGSRKVALADVGPSPQLHRKFVDATEWLEDWELHPEGHSLVLTVRGKPVTLAAHEGPAVQHGVAHGVRYRLARYLPDGERVVAVSDAGGEEAFEVLRLDGGAGRRLEPLDIGRPIEVAVDPRGEYLAFTNHRFEVGVIELDRGLLTLLDRSEHGRCEGLAWSSDGAWLAYGRPTSPSDTAQIRIADVRAGTVHDVTDGRYKDLRPSFDPAGRCLWFLSFREFDPVYDGVFFDLGFPKAMRPYAAVLQADAPSPFVREPRSPAAKADERADDPGPTGIDFATLPSRIVPFPVPEGRYERVVGVKGKVLFTTVPVLGGRQVDWRASGPPPARATLSSLDLATGEVEELYRDVTDFTVDNTRKALAYRSGARLRVVPVGKPPAKDAAGRRNGWVDLARATVAIEPAAEWTQMFREVWRLQRDHFWTADMSGVDWAAMYTRYAPLVARAATRGEVSDLMWELIAELGTSHAYEMLGDHRKPPSWRIGKLGADFAWDGSAWRISGVVTGEVGDLDRSSPLTAPGVNVQLGDQLLAIDGLALTLEQPPGAALTNRAGREVELTLQTSGRRRTVRVRTLTDETPARYREWVIRNRERVHAETVGRVGYVHIPDMGPDGFAEFHRDYLTECLRDALLVDVRFNRGGHVSQLLLEKLARRAIGSGVSRWEKGPHTYPAHAVRGPMLALTNEFAGSDGDIFSHGFKLMGLGPLVGTRTWGGVIGIWPRNRLVDGTIATQPEYCNRYDDIGPGLENFGAVPDVVVEMRPEDYASGVDPQLERAIAMLAGALTGAAIKAD